MAARAHKRLGSRDRAYSMARRALSVRPSFEEARCLRRLARVAAQSVPVVASVARYVGRLRSVLNQLISHRLAQVSVMRSKRIPTDYLELAASDSDPPSDADLPDAEDLRTLVLPY